MTRPVLALAAAHGQGWHQISLLLIAFGLSSVVGLERELRGKSAGLRTQTIVGTASALIVLVSKYGFGDVLHPNLVVLDPSRVAAQIVSGIGFLGAGLIITRQGAIKGLTTAASVWETAAIGMAAGAGLPVLAVIVVGLHFVITFGYTPLSRRLPLGTGSVSLLVTYCDGQGVLRRVLSECSDQGWVVTALSVSSASADLRDVIGASEGRTTEAVSVTMAIAGRGVREAAARLGVIDGVIGVRRADEDRE